MCRGYKDMKNKCLSGAVPIAVLLAVFVLTCAFNLWITPQEKVTVWQYQTVLSEDVVYYSDSESEGPYYSEPVLFQKGTAMKVGADITPRTADSKQNGSDYYFTESFIYCEDGKIMPVTVTTDQALCGLNISEGFDNVYVSAIHISRVDFNERLIPSFEGAKDDCIKDDKDMRLMNLLVGTVPAIGLAIGMLILRYFIVKNGKYANKLFWTFLSIDCLSVVYALIKLFQWISGN